MDYNERKGPYHGLWILIVFGLGYPALMYFVFSWTLTNNAWRVYPTEFIQSESLALAGLIGTFVILGFIVSGGLAKPFKTVVSRVKELIEDLSISKTEAFKWYWYRVKTEGVVLWIVLLILIANIILLTIGIVSFMKVSALV
ncbi:MAG: hypothetical protein PHW00_04530 [Clostridia bacterium]|nr:hypothetical protein [Clostridia bacterium]